MSKKKSSNLSEFGHEVRYAIALLLVGWLVVSLCSGCGNGWTKGEGPLFTATFTVGDAPMSGQGAFGKTAAHVVAKPLAEPTYPFRTRSITPVRPRCKPVTPSYARPATPAMSMSERKKYVQYVDGHIRPVGRLRR